VTLGTRLWYEWSVVRIVSGTKSPDTFTAILALKIAAGLFLREQLP